MGFIGCSTNGGGKMNYELVERDYDPPAKEGGVPILKQERFFKVGAILPKALDTLQNFVMNKLGITFKSMNAFEIKVPPVSGTFTFLLGIGLLLAAGAVAYYLKQYIIGGLLAAAGVISMCWQTLEPIFSGMVIIAIIGAVAAAIIYGLGKWAKVVEAKKDGQTRAADIVTSDPEDTSAAVAVRRATDPAFEKKFLAEKAMKKKVKKDPA
jgi:hypothetical protein